MAWTATQGKAYDIGTDGSTSDFQNAFDEVEKEIVYLLDAGSRVIDEIGSTDDYDFMFVNDINRLKLTVGGQALDAARIDDVTYGFGKDESLSEGYKFILTYYENVWYTVERIMVSALYGILMCLLKKQHQFS